VILQLDVLCALSAFPLHARPTCPTVLIPFEEQLYSLPAQKLDVNVEFQISTAFVRVTGKWQNIAIYKVRLGYLLSAFLTFMLIQWVFGISLTAVIRGEQSDCMFVLPLNGTVTSISIKVANRLYETVVLPKDEVKRVAEVCS